jgi:hypothetical protein
VAGEGEPENRNNKTLLRTLAIKSVPKFPSSYSVLTQEGQAGGRDGKTHKQHPHCKMSEPKEVFSNMIPTTGQGLAQPSPLCPTSPRTAISLLHQKAKARWPSGLPASHCSAHRAMIPPSRLMRGAQVLSRRQSPVTATLASKANRPHLPRQRRKPAQLVAHQGVWKQDSAVWGTPSCSRSLPAQGGLSTRCLHSESLSWQMCTHQEQVKKMMIACS